MKYKVGDKVRVREDLEVGKCYVGKFYNDFYINKKMAKLKGKVVEIKGVVGYLYYIIESDYVWTSEMFSGLAEESRNLIPLIAKELGVEMGEEFEISNKVCVYKFTEDGLMGIVSNGIYDADCVFLELINGKEKIIKLPKKPILTEDEKVILRNIPEKYEYIARDNSGELYVFENKPKKYGNGWNSYSLADLGLFQSLFQFIRWENEEPYNIEELLKE